MGNNIHEISSFPLSFEDLKKIVTQPTTLSLSNNSVHAIQRCRDYLYEKLNHSWEPLYGINTGFGSLYDRNISKDQLAELQVNLVKSHACGIGPEVSQDIVRLMLFAKAQSLAYGYSGVEVATVKRIVDFFNHGVYPRIFEIGSLGASGDLCPLAHLALPLIGLGEVRHEGACLEGERLKERFGWIPLKLGAKEGLALLNGTQFMGAYSWYCVVQAHRLMEIAPMVAALSLDVFDGRTEPFLPLVQHIRPHKGQVYQAKKMMEWLAGSALMQQPKIHVQDPYSFRCIPQVHGASWDALQHVTEVLLTEMNSVTDNPNIFPEENLIISSGNFHGQPLALSMDYLSMAMSEMGNISERRIFQLISGSRELPNYLVANPGIHSGLMIPQYTAAALVNKNKLLCAPASVDSIVSSNGQEDHVSMGGNAVTKAFQVIENTYSILAIEWLTATQALHFRRPFKTSPKLEGEVDTFRKLVPFIDQDRILHFDIKKTESYLKSLDF